MKKLALAIALVFASTGLTFAAGQNKPATATTTKAKKHKKTKKNAKTAAQKK
jgi:hypothetical protein